MTIYFALFFNAFIAATLLPAFSELGFAGALKANAGPPLFLFIAVTAGNVLGSVVNWILGKEILRFQKYRWFPFTPVQIDKATKQFDKYGKWSLLFAWLPVVGDPLTLVAGIMRVRFAFFLILVLIGKALRYAIIYQLVTST